MSQKSTITIVLDIKTLSKGQLQNLNVAILLRRVSDISQSDGFSLPAQERYGREYISSKNLTLVTDFCITETASKHYLRSSFDQMVKEVIKLSKLTSSPVNLVVEKPDRLSRNF